MGRELHRLFRFGIVDEAHGAGEVLSWHTHDAPLLSLVLEGGYEEVYGRRHFRCAPFDVVMKPGGERHRDSVGERGARSLLVALSATEDPELERFAGSLTEPRLVSDPAVRSLVRRVAREWRARDEWSSLSLESTLLELVVFMGRGERGRSAGRGAPAWLARADDFIREAFRRAFPLDELAKECGVHPSHLARAFRKFRGCSVGERVRALRVDAALTALIESDAPLAEIALSSGFYDQSHMGRVLKRFAGTSPGEIRGRRAGAEDVLRPGRRKATGRRRREGDPGCR